MALTALPSLMYGALVLFFAGTALSFFHSRRPIKIVEWVLSMFDREGDRLPGMGIITFFLGILLVWTIFPRDIAVIGTMVMSFGDPMASAVGITFGSHPCPYNRKKTIEGTASFVLTAFAVLLPMFGPAAASAGALGGALVESFPHPRGSIVNDNVTVPLGASAAAYLVTAAFGL
jgi:dolichol kinase